MRRALEARSAGVSPEFRGRLSGVLADGRPSRDRLPALALVAALLLAAATLGAFALIRHAAPRPVPGAVLSSPTPSPLFMPGYADSARHPGGVVWAYVDGTSLFRSTDRGTTWEQRPLPSRLRGQVEISFVSDQEGYLVVLGLPNSTCADAQVDVLYTADAGATWHGLGAGGIPHGRCMSSLSFIDANHGFLTAYDDSHSPVIYRTSDGARSWQPSSPLADPPGWTSAGAGYTLQAGDVRAVGGVLLVGAYGERTDSTAAAYVFRSVDGGVTWTYIATAQNQGNGVVFLSATHWLQGPFVETTDAGATWHAMATDYTQAAGVAPMVVFADDRVGYATVRGEIQVTSDGGVHWIAIHTPGT